MRRFKGLSPWASAAAVNSAAPMPGFARLLWALVGTAVFCHTIVRGQIVLLRRNMLPIKFDAKLSLRIRRRAAQQVIQARRCALGRQAWCDALRGASSAAAGLHDSGPLPPPLGLFARALVEVSFGEEAFCQALHRDLVDRGFREAGPCPDWDAFLAVAASIKGVCLLSLLLALSAGVGALLALAWCSSPGVNLSLSWPQTFVAAYFFLPALHT